jgi:hypothetical protein
MRCEEARRLISQGAGAPDKLLIEHIGQCPDCARFAEASRLTEQLLRDAGKPEPVISFSAVRDRVNMIAKQQTTWEKIMSQIRDQYQTRPRLMTGMGLAVAVLFFIVLVPFSVNHTVGWNISMDGIDANAAPSPDLMNATLAAAGLGDVYVENISEDSNDGTLDEIYVNTPSKEEARHLARAIIASAAAEAVQVNVEPVIRIKSQTLLAQVYDRVKLEEDPPVRIRFEEGLLLINGEGIFETLRSPDLTDEEVKEEIGKIMKLDEDTGAEASIEVETSEDGRTRIVEIQTTNASLSHALSNIELHASDRVLAVKYGGDVDIPDSAAVVQVMVPDDDDGDITTKGVKIKIVIDLDE